MKTPWKSAYKFCRQKRVNPDIEVRDTDTRLVAVVPRCADQKRQEKIARLIVAAPQLVDALKNVSRLWDDGRQFDQGVNKESVTGVFIEPIQAHA